MQSPLPLARELVLIGGGHAHALVLRKWGMNPLPGARLTVVNPGPTAPYTGMLPGHVAGHYTREELDIDLVRLARFAGARLILGRATGIDHAAKRIHIEGHAPIAYDVTSVDVGITSDLPNIPGFAEHAHPAKPLDRFAHAWRAHLDRVAQGATREVVVIGGGVAGAELAMAMAHQLGSDAVTVIESGAETLSELTPRARRAILDEARKLGISARTGVEVTEVGPDFVMLSNGERMPAAFTVGAARARPQDWLADTGLELHEGYIAVGETLQSLTDPAIFAAGDCAHLSHAPRPKAGVFAVREAPVLHDNLRAALTGRAMRRFRPQRDYLKLVSLGGKSALAHKFGLSVKRPALWRWKDHIDRKFMEKFRDLPQMARAPLPAERALDPEAVAQADQPLCGGCGSKVGSGALSGVLETLPSGGRADVLTRAGDDAAVLKLGEARQVLTTDHLRAFTEDPWLLARITAIHALGDIWAMGATPQAALASIVLPRMRPAMQEAWLAEIMEAANAVFAAEGAEIVGGHTTMGAELTIGFTLTGLCERQPIRVDGARPGDALILTKPIGTGTILAAEMAQAARGQWVADALAAMSVPQGDAARVLAGAHAMTDVTGFGLAGHLMTMLEASGAGARLQLSDIPLYDGAEVLSARGIRSTIWGENHKVAAQMVLPETPAADLLFDPQTAGGLLAAVPAGDADELVKKLRETGLSRVAKIGEIVEGPSVIEVI
ncbi:MAG: selenide, water dikinase SelD [Rhodobacteraceae bacterium]|nr:selenide, water dikinase SelD [Paracoccaceae bacterium]